MRRADEQTLMSPLRGAMIGAWPALAVPVALLVGGSLNGLAARIFETGAANGLASPLFGVSPI